MTTSTDLKDVPAQDALAPPSYFDLDAEVAEFPANVLRTQSYPADEDLPDDGYPRSSEGLPMMGHKLTEEDVAWTEERTIELMHEGTPLVEAIQKAAMECTQRILRREFEQETRFIVALEEERERRREERQKQQAAEHEKLRAELQAKATPGQQPTLKVTLGDMLARRR